MNHYTSPEIEIIKFSVLDVICASEATTYDSERDNAYVAAKDLFGKSIEYF